MSAHGHNSISNCVRAARNGSEEASLFTEREHEPAPLKAKEQLLLQSLRKSATKGPHLQRKAATAKKRAAVAVEDRDFGVAVASRGSGLLPRAAPTPAPAPAATQAQRRDAPVVAKVFASKAERRKAKKQARAPPSAREEAGGEEAPSEARSKKAKSSLRQAAPSGFGSPSVQLVKPKAAVADSKASTARTKRKKVAEKDAEKDADAPEPKRRAGAKGAGDQEAAGTATAPSKPPKTSKRGERPEGDQLQAALAAAAGPGDSAAAEAYTPGCVLKLMQLKSAKGADGKYVKGHMAALKEKLGGEAGGLLCAHALQPSSSP